MNSYSTRTVDFLAITVSKNGAAFNGEFEVAVHKYGTPPTTWSAPVIRDGKRGIRIADLTPGYWHATPRITDAAPYKPELDPITFLVHA